MKLTWKDYAEIGGDLLAVFLALLFGHWIGFALAVVFIALIYGYKMTVPFVLIFKNELLSKQKGELP